MDKPVSRISPQLEYDVDILREQRLFADVDMEGLGPLLKQCPTRRLKKHDVLVNAGDANRCLYLVISGGFRVHLQSDPHNPVTWVAAGQSIGEFSLVDRQAASACVVADTESQVLVINEDLFWQMIESNHTIAYNLLLLLAQRLRQGNSVMSRIRELLSEYEHNATVDSLTGLYNRRWLDDMLTRVMQRCHTNGQPLSVLMMDIDYFKQYNDKHGHIAGDAALRIVSRQIVQNLRPEDLVARYGGEEFFALLPGLDLAAAESVSERLRDSLARAEIRQHDKSALPSLTISIGVASMGANDKPGSLTEAADQALYRAKHSGRNRVSH